MLALFLRFLQITLVGGIVLFLFIYVLSRGEILNYNKREWMHRVVCRSNLKEIAEVIRGKGILVDKDSVREIQTILEDLALSCPSGRRVQLNPKDSQYKIVSEEQHVFITEHRDNHDTNHMRLTNLPYVRHVLQYNRNTDEFTVVKSREGN